jgi:hypothetical protein
MSRGRLITRSLIAMALACAPSVDVAAQSRGAFVPSVSIGTIHDDNLFSRKTAVGDYMTQLRPTLDGIFKSPTVDLRSEISIDMQLSARHSALNSYDARRHAMFDGKVQKSAALGFGLIGRYDTTQSPAELNFESAVLLDRQQARRWQLTPSTTYRMSPRTTLSAQYDWTSEALSNWTGGDLHVARLGLSRQRSPRTNWTVHYLGRLFLNPANQHWSQTALLGWNRQLTPTTRLSLQAGPRVTSYHGVTAEVLATFVKRTPHGRLLTDYWHGETIVLGIIGPVRVHSGTVKWTRTVRRNLDLGANVGMFNSTTIDRALARVVHTAAIAAWRFGDHYLLTTSYGADFQKGDIRSRFLQSERIRRGVFLVRLTIAPRLNGELTQPEESDQPSTPVKGVIK